MEEMMADDSIRIPDARRKRIKRLKRYIVLTLLLFLLIPTVLCLVLLVRVNRLNGALDGVKTGAAALEQLVREQDKALEELAAEIGELTVRTAELTAETEAVRVQTQQSEKTVSAGEQEASETEAVTAAHRVYLTFDDGPSAYTEEILDILDEYEVKATFFVVGKESDTAKEAMREIVRRGHTLGMHSYSHKYSELYASKESFQEDFERIREYLYEVTGVWSTLYRFPGGSSNTVSEVDMEELAAYLDAQEVRFFDWNISSGDGGRELLSVDELTKNVTEDIGSHEVSVVLMHDSQDKPTTVEALRGIIEDILALDDTAILPITEETEPVQHIHYGSS